MRAELRNVRRGQHGQDMVEYAGVLVVVAAILLEVLSISGIGATLGSDINTEICHVFQGSCGSSGTGRGPGPIAGAPGARSPGGPGAQPGGPGAQPGGPGAQPGAPGSGAPGNQIGPPCSGLVGGVNCVTGVGSKLANGPDSLLAKLHQANQALLNSGARPGTPEYNALVAARNRALGKYLTAKGVANSAIVQRLNKLKKVSNPSLDDILRRGEGPAARAVRAAEPTPEGLLSRGGSALSKVGKGLGIVGVGYGGYQNVSHDGVGKGITETVTGVAGATVFASAAEAACAPVDLTGVGVVACGALGVAAASFGNSVGKFVGGELYDHALVPAYHAVVHDVAQPVYKHVLKPLGHFLSSLNPFS